MNYTKLPIYAYKEIRDNFDNRFWWRNRIFHRIIAPFHLNIYPTRKGSVKVMSEDWDTLVVLDACRFDLFEATAPINQYDEYRTVISAGSATQEWVEQNLAGGTFGDTVYVTANPFVSREASSAFHELVEPWLTQFDEESRTVPPNTVTEMAKKLHENFPDKRIIVHYMQPHHPFIDSPDLQYHGWKIDDFAEWTKHKDETGLADAQHGDHPHTPWEALYMGLVSQQQIWEAYKKNLDRVLSSVDDLLANIEGKTVITSDHGNMLGGRTWPIPMRVFGHPSGIRNNALVKVPWAIHESGSRREIKKEGTKQSANHDESLVRDRLQDLGYV